MTPKKFLKLEVFLEKFIIFKLMPSKPIPTKNIGKHNNLLKYNLCFLAEKPAFSNILIKE